MYRLRSVVIDANAKQPTLDWEDRLLLLGPKFCSIERGHQLAALEF